MNCNLSSHFRSWKWAERTNYFAQGHAANKGQIQDLNPDLSDDEVSIMSTTPHCKDKAAFFSDFCSA